MARTENKRMICAILAAVMLLSNIPVAVFAQEDTYCGLEHEHEEACYVAPATESTTEPATEAPTEKITEPPTEPPTKAPAGAEMTLQQKLLAAETLRQLHDLLMEDKEKTRTLTIEELAAVKAHAEALYAGIAEPTQDDADYYELITGTIAYLESQLVPEKEEEKTEGTEPETTPVTLEEPILPDNAPVGGYYYFDLYAGDLTIDGSGGVTTLTGYRYDGNSTEQKIEVSITGTDPVKVYVYQSNHEDDYQNTGIIDGKVNIPNPARVSGWGQYITNNTDVEDVISEWIGKGRPSTENNIHVTGTVNCEMVLDNLYSTFQTHNKTRQDGGIGFVTVSSTRNSTLTLKIKGDNRFGNIYYCSGKGNNNKIIFEDYPSQKDAGTLTIANVEKNSNGNYWCAAIGGNDNGGLVETSDGIVINSGTLFTGTNEKDDCTAIGGGGNGYGGVTINGGTVTAVVTSSGAAIGGGIGKTDKGGEATVTINGGAVYAYNNSCKSSYSLKGVKYIPAAAIGGGSSARAICNSSVVNITGGTVYAQSVGGTAIGGGSSADNDGGSTTINITGGTVEAYSIPGTIDGQSVPAGVAIGGGTGYNVGGSATLNVSGDAVLRTGSIGGGGFGDKDDADSVGGVIGYAQVTITSGNIRGQVVMEGKGSFLTMSGGTINNEKVAGVDYSKCHFVKENGGAACVETGTVDISGTAIIQNASAEVGGAIYLSDGNVTMSNGTITNCNAQLGGAVYVTGGNFTMTGGTVENCTATNGGAVFVDGGNVDISGGSILSNTADVNGGGIAVNNGQVVMSGGSISGNTATAGEGGGMYVSSTGTRDVSVKVFSGALENNTAAKTGGAVAVRGESGNITVQIGVNENHHFVDGKPTYPIDHTDDGKTYSHESCPLIKNNASGSSGGAFYINSSQSDGADNETHLNIYCLTGEGNHTDGDTNPLNEHMSNFLMVEGGRVYLSTGETYENVEGTPSDSPVGDDASGNMTIKGSIHVVSGILELFGSKDNPRLEGALTIDLQDDDDRYIDHRGSEDKLTISYHENFFRPDGTPDSAQTAFDVISGQTHTIYSGLYVHEGYKLHGWNIDKEANAVSTTDGWYEANTVYEFRMPDGSHPAGTVENGVYYGDLTLYAIWKVNGYYAAYVAGVPTDQEWTGETRTETYTYDEEYALPGNWFVWPGHVFAGWKLPDGTVKQPDENISNLTTENAATVTITAQWTVCEHPDEHVSFSSNGTDTITKTCNLCGLNATAKLSAQDAVYDGNRHEATLECADADFWNPQIQYVGHTIRPQDADENWKPAKIAENRLCIGAGNYAVRIFGGDQAVSVQYTIAKAKQAAPQTRPTYKQPEENSNIVSIDLLPADEQTSPQSGAQAEYFVRYYDNGTEITEKTVDTDTSAAGIQHSLRAALRTYAVLIGYPETDDYLPSDLIAAETTFMFAGSLHLTIKAEEGIDFWPGAAEDEQMTIYVKLRDGYYLTGEGFDFKKESSTEGYDVEKITIKKAKPDDPLDYGYFVGAEPANEETHITITIGGVKKIADIRSSIREKQHFSDFADQTDPVISNDSAFTLRYDITAYDTEVFDQPVLSFTSGDAAKQLPAGTTIILRDRNDGSYWYTEIEEGSSNLGLGSFRKMAADGGSYTAQTGDLKLQFIVDFSRAGQMGAESLSCTLTANKKDPKGKAETLTGTETVKLAGAQLTLGKVEGAGLTQTVNITSGAGGAASKYDHRDVALVLEPKNALPKDAMMRMVLDGTHSDWRPDKSGKFIISLGNFRSLNTDIVLELNSAMFPLEETTYLMDAKLYLSGTDAEIAPLNTTPLHTVALSFTSDRDKTGVSIAVDWDQRLFTTAEDITAAITVKPEDYTDSYNLVVELHQELDGVAFGDTTLKPKISGNSYTFDLAGRATGDYCIVATLQTKAGYVINEARYYFIVEPEKSN